MRPDITLTIGKMREKCVPWKPVKSLMKFGITMHKKVFEKNGGWSSVWQRTTPLNGGTTKCKN